MEKSDTRERRERKKKQDTEIFEMGDVVTKACSNETKNNCGYKKSSVTSVQNVKSCGSYIYMNVNTLLQQVYCCGCKDTHRQTE